MSNPKYKSLYEIYNEICSDDKKILRIDKEDCQAFLTAPNLESANAFIMTYYENRGKEKVLLFNKKMLNLWNRVEGNRSAHMVSAFLLGLYIKNNMPVFNILDGYHFFTHQDPVNSTLTFEYLWFLCCLYHDRYSPVEEDRSVEPKERSLDDVLRNYLGKR